MYRYQPWHRAFSDTPAIPLLDFIAVHPLENLPLNAETKNKEREKRKRGTVEDRFYKRHKKEYGWFCKLAVLLFLLACESLRYPTARAFDVARPSLCWELTEALALHFFVHPDVI